MKNQTVKNIMIKGCNHTLVVNDSSLISAYNDEGCEIYNPGQLSYIEGLWRGGITPSF